MSGLSEAGLGRFVDYPGVLADDLFVEPSFGRDEIDIVGDGPVVVTAPAYYCDLPKPMRRAHRGAIATQMVAEASATEATSPRSTTATTLRDAPRLCRDNPGFVNATTRAFLGSSARGCIARARWAPRVRDESPRIVTATPRDEGSAS